AAHHVSALDPLEFSQVESEGLLFAHVGIDGQFRHPGLHAGLKAVNAIHHHIVSPGFVDAWNFGKSQQFIESYGFVEVRNIAAVKFKTDDLTLGGTEERELRRGMRWLPESDAGHRERQHASGRG